ncbi:type VI secretion system lipoprotein IglE [Piscirickettsia litoralis]|uniref:Type VI lipoprotein IgE-like C-terminal domain-containing protein n=1 Tax=Piscirickettsia litoralis TaxID=1891921 RepID=A0ABX2ZW98_9GAMM|nr:type VI secretion system lipoprotein IglE [Piscirickettsia litoralis]ODN40921.1 hypothetical protein BGC07_19065 [Piscirickettsia litoralis]
MRKLLIKVSSRLFIITLIFILTGCSMLGLGGDTELTIKVKTNKFTNNGNNFYMLVAQDDDKNYVSNSYYSLYSQFNSSRYKRYFITPQYESSYSFSYPLDLKKSTSLYFLFNNESRQWKVRVKPGIKKVTLEVKNDRVIMDQ